MKNGKRWVLALGIAAAGVIGGAGGVAATTAEEVATGYTIASHDEDDESPDNSGKEKAGEKGTGDSRNDDDESKSGDSSDKADDDASDANDTDGPGDDEDD